LLEIVVALYSKCSSKVKAPVCLYVKLKNCKEKRGCAREGKVQRVFFQGRNWISRERPWRLVYVTICGNTWRYMEVDFASTKEKCREIVFAVKGSGFVPLVRSNFFVWMVNTVIF
jgi:hypothetical protein